MVGMDPWTLGLQMHQVQVESLLDKMSVKYAPQTKYYLAGKPAEGPEKPTVLLV